MGIMMANQRILHGIKSGFGFFSPAAVDIAESRKEKRASEARALPVAATSSITLERAVTTPAVPQQTWTLEEYQKLFRNYLTEEEYEIEDIEGTIPAGLEGTFYRNGPGILEFDGQKMHAFDGHGLIAKVGFKDGRAHFKSRFVRTKVYEEETKANKVLYRGFGSTKPGGFLSNFMDTKDKPVANTSILEWGGKLYALWEAHNPITLDPNTLETLGEETFDGALREAQPFTAHPSFDKFTDRLVAFSNGIRHGEGKLHIWEIDRDNKIQKAITHKVGLLPVLYLHDFQVTENWCIFHQAPLALQPGNMMQYFAGLKDQTKQIGFEATSPGKWWLVPRNGNPPQIIETEPAMIWHYGNAHEDEAGNVVVDACTMNSFSFESFDMRDPATVPVSEVARFRIDPVAKTSERTTLVAQPCDFPRLNPVYRSEPSYKFMYCAATKDTSENFPFQRILKLNVQTKEHESWLAPPGCFIGEPIFVPRSTVSLEKEFSRAAAGKAGQAGDNLEAGHTKPGSVEDDGWIACLISDCRKEYSSLAIFDAQNLGNGPVCKVNMKKLLPMAFHCAWSETAFV